MKSKKDAYERLIIKVLSLLIAIAIFTTIRYGNLDKRSVILPLDVTLPEHLVALSLVPQEIEVIITGDNNLVYKVDPDKIKASANFSSATDSGVSSVPITLEYDLGFYEDSTIYVRANPDVVRIKFEE